jgi:hypothetical protein
MFSANFSNISAILWGYDWKLNMAAMTNKVLSLADI